MAAAVKKEVKSSTKTSAAKQNEDITDSNVKDIVSDNDVGDSTSDNSMSDANPEIVSDDAEETLITAAEISAELLTENLELYAKTDILFHNHRYSLGDKLPTDDVEMVEAWERADTAEWR